MPQNDISHSVGKKTQIELKWADGNVLKYGKFDGDKIVLVYSHSKKKKKNCQCQGAKRGIHIIVKTRRVGNKKNLAIIILPGENILPI